MADEKLKVARVKLVKGLNRAVLNNLLDRLQDARVFNPSEAELVLEGRSTTMEKARGLVDMVVKKGPVASEIFFRCLEEEDAILHSTLQL
ncbi:CASP1 protein, partial [Amia calva]|nr:CASP1 protein [Amia calva]